MMDRRAFGFGTVASIAAPATPLLAREKVGILFFGAGWCHYCHQAAAILHQLRVAGQIEIFAVSLDGEPLGVLQDVVPDDGRAAQLGVVGVPQTFIFDPKTKTPVPVISGFPSAAQYVSALRQAAALILKG